MNNSKTMDNGARLIFGNATLCSQLLRDYSGLEILRDVTAEDIEDVTERFLPMFTEERDADVVKKVHLPKGEELFVVTLIDHKSAVDYNVSMQLLRYMVFIWEDYEKRMEKECPGIARTKDFRYPPILPIVYYEGKREWTAQLQFSDRIFLNNVFGIFIPHFMYKLIQLNSFTNEEIVGNEDELSLLMLVNRLKSSDEFRRTDLPEGYLNHIAEKAPKDVLDVISRVITVLLRRIEVPEEEIYKITDRIRERKMGELFADFETYSVAETRRVSREEGHKEEQTRLIEDMLCRGKSVEEIVDFCAYPRELVEKVRAGIETDMAESAHTADV